MTPSYTIYYWAIAIRGNFVRVLFAHAGVPYTEAPISEVIALRALPLNEQPYPSMAPPFLHDHEEDVFLSQRHPLFTTLDTSSTFSHHPTERRASV